MTCEILARAPRVRPLVACVAIALALSGSPGLAGDRAHATSRRAQDYTGWREQARAFLAAHDPRPHAASIEAPAGSTIVTSCDDDGPGTLRQAYRNAITGENIDLTQLPCSTITLTTGALEDSPTAADVTLQGPGKYLLTIDGGDTDRVLIHNGSGTLSITGMTIAHGSYTGPLGGGCIYSQTSVEVFDTLLTSCSKTGTGSDTAFGGAIYARRAAAVTGSQIRDNTVHADAGNSAGAGVWAEAVSVSISTISGNAASADGAHYARGGGVLSLTETEISYATISGNEAISGGGVFLVGAAAYTLRIRNSTISGNHASGAGGGVYAKYRPFTVANSTVTANTAGEQFGAGLFLAYATDLQSTIVALNTSQNGAFASDVGSPYAIAITGANNLVMGTNLPLPADTIAPNPMLGPLQDNGGFTMTHALLPGSPAIDRGNDNGAFEFDQRLFTDAANAVPFERVVGPAADIGAFEFGAPDRIFVDGFDD